MIEPLSVIKSMASPLGKLFTYAYAKFRRPSVALARVPKNLFEHVKPGVSLSRVKEVLGTPHHEADGQIRYLFEEACIQIDADQGSVVAVSVGLTSVKNKNCLHIWPLNNLVLGKTTFASVVTPEEKVEFEYSSKFYHFYVVQYYGFPGFYWNYALGVLECPRVFPERYHWSPSRPKDEIPKEMKINWACVTSLEKPPYFNYYGFL